MLHRRRAGTFDPVRREALPSPSGHDSDHVSPIVSALDPRGATTLDEDGAASRPSAIVVPIDGAELALRAVTVARRWAATFGADLFLVVVEDEHDRSELDDMQSDPSVPSTVWRTVPARSALAQTVIDVAAQQRPSAVCMATRAGSPLVDVVSDDPAQLILRSVDVPVLLVGPHCSPEPTDGPVVVAHDSSAATASVLDPARVWAAASGVPPVLLHVHQPMVGLVAEVMPTLQAARKRLGPSASLEIVRSSFPGGAIREYAHEVDASMLALTTRGRTDMLTASTGTTSTWVVRQSPCPVLVAHPPALGAR